MILNTFTAVQNEEHHDFVFVSCVGNVESSNLALKLPYNTLNTYIYHLLRLLGMK